ncbi:MAG: ABC transporter ATP-binding protein [Deltaproteobacteria bacterium]|nr:ABC transporter ATP-binding protein [Deltaproteobacteria bacterium]
MLLELKQAGIRFGGLRAVADLDLAIPPGGLYGLIGPNGAGKTTVFNLVTGIYSPTEGDIRLEGRSIVGLGPARVAASGIGRTFQNIRLFGGLSVAENVKVAMNRHLHGSLLESIFRAPRYWADDRALCDEAARLLDAFGLAGVANLGAEELPYGLRRRLEIARALATRPKLLLLDEPAAGMNPSESDDLMHLIRWTRDTFGVTVLLIEHHMPVVMGICERITVLDHGARIAEGTPEQIRRDPTVIEAYLGAEAAHA